jgi:RimJ/RimL family protein N-acetyltransferase
VLKLGFSLGVNRIEASCDTRNLRAIRFAEQLGMRREGVLRSHSRDPQRVLSDDVLLSMLRDDPWPEWAPRMKA